MLRAVNWGLGRNSWNRLNHKTEDEGNSNSAGSSRGQGGTTKRKLARLKKRTASGRVRWRKDQGNGNLDVKGQS